MNLTVNLDRETMAAIRVLQRHYDSTDMLKPTIKSIVRKAVHNLCEQSGVEWPKNIDDFYVEGPKQLYRIIGLR